MTANLTKNQQFVFETLLKQKSPLSAYTLLDQLRDHGFRAPLQIYRALDRLVQLGLVHKLQSINAYIACAQPENKNHHLAAFALCQKCGKVNEFFDSSLKNNIDVQMKKMHFYAQTTTLEIRGLCCYCAAVS